MALGDTLRLLVTGASGQVGGELVHALAPLGTVGAPSRSEMDLADQASVRSHIKDHKPHWIINAAAYTAVDKAESETDLAYAINAVAAEAIGQAAHETGAKVIHFSTDYVFNGQGMTPWVETDPTGPLGVYGASKLAGEQALLASGAAVMIFRTSWVYGATGKNFLRTILKLAHERAELRIVDDQHGAPTWSRDLARLAAHVIGRLEAVNAAYLDQFAGIYHAAGQGETTWAGFAREGIGTLQKRNPGAPLATVEGIPTAEYPTAARRPTNSRLNCAKLEQVFGWKMMHWQTSLQRVMEELP